ncbi:MAG: tyrosine-type recombinase/integrase, partial [Myxococcaceae bacterium]
KQQRPEWQVLTKAEIQKLLPYLRDDRRREALVMLFLGPRPGELKALRKEDLDLSRGVVTWCRSNARDSTKTGRVRTVPIPPGVLPVFREAVKRSPSALVFPDAGGKRQRHDVKLGRTLRTALARAGIVDRHDYSCRRKGCGHRESHRLPQGDLRCPTCGMKLWCHPVGKRLRWYDLRHSAASLHREAGCDPLVIQIALGHAARSTTDAIYTHLSDDYMRRELSKLVIRWPRRSR